MYGWRFLLYGFKRFENIFYFCFFLEGSFFVEGDGVGENVKVWSGKKVERYDFRERKLLGSVLVFVGRV